jgi:tetratricopeptide (TPR) repeat protein
MKAESCYSIARRYHVNAEYDRAQEFYREAVKRAKEGKVRLRAAYLFALFTCLSNCLSSGFAHSLAQYAEFLLPHFGLGQLCMWKEEYDDAIKHFEAVLKVRSLSQPRPIFALEIFDTCYLNHHEGEPGELRNAQGAWLALREARCEHRSRNTAALLLSAVSG